MEPKPEPPKIEIEQKTLKILNKTRKWTMFLSIIGFIINGLIIVFGLLTGAFLTIFKAGQAESLVPDQFYIAAFFFLSVLCFIPVLFLFRFSKFTARAVHNLSQKDLHRAFRNLKLLSIYIGIFVIIMLMVYIGILLFVGSTMSIPKGLF